MKKRFLSLLCVLALCLGLLPATALAEENAPTTLYVGSTTITAGYWTSSDGGTTWTNTQQSDPPSGDSYIHYNGQGTLELHNATIHRGSNTVSAPYGSGIYALSSSGQPVALTIELIGTNTITGDMGIYVAAEASATSYGTDASLAITSENNGSLQVSGLNYGIYVTSGTGNASLTINDASVVAKTTQTYSGCAGVCVQSGANATNSPNISLSVDGGSLTASGTGSSDGILFYVGSSQATGATTSLTVSENAIVDARNGGISALKITETLPTPTPTGDNRSGIVFDGKNGTVYGEVTLQENLTIGEGETLTIPEGSSLNASGKLTNEGTINVESGGNLEGEPTSGSGTVVNAPSIGTQPASQSVTEGGTAEFSVTATGKNLSYQWQQKTSGSEWTNIPNATSSTYAITNTTTDMSGNQYRCVVSNSAGSVISDAATLTVGTASVSVTGVTLDKTSLSLFTGNTATLTATVQPSNATNQNVTWQSDNANVATVEGGTVTAVGVGETTIRVTTEEGNYTATCKVTVTQSTYSISADTTALNFGSVYTGYAQPAARTVTITNTGNQTQPLTLTASTGSFEVGTLTKTQLAAGEKATFTVQPKAGLAVGTYSENITVSGTGGATVTITASFTVKQYSSGGSSSSTPSVSDQAIDKIEAAKDGSTVSIKLPVGRTTLEGEVFETLAGQDITLEISLSNGVTWTVNGQDIPKNAKLSDLDLGVSLNTSTIPVSVINTVTGAVDTIQLSLKHDGEFGFTMTLSAPLGKTNAGYWANLYYYNIRTRALEFQSASKIAADGTASFPFDHASDYAIVIDTDSHEPVELPFTDVPEDAWYEDAAAYVYKHGLMAGTSATTFAPDVTTSRAMIATILWRMAGSPVVNYAMTYTDVAQGQWYSEAVRWATSEGVVTGYGNGLFGTNDPITREQLATMLWRYAQTEDYDVSVGEDTNILSYTDAFDVAEYAIPAMQWACGSGLMEGSNGSLNPRAKATRAEVATMLMRWMKRA